MSAFPSRVVVLRALRLGDMLCAVPALRALRNGLPGAEIVLVGLPWAAEFVSRFDQYLDRFISFPGWDGLPESEVDDAAIPTFLEEVRAQQFDLAIQLHGSGEVTNGIVQRFGAAETWAFGSRPTSWEGSASFVDYPREGHEIQRLLHLMTANGLPSAGEHLEFPVTPSERAEARCLLADAGVTAPFVLVHPGGSTATRRWPAEAFGAVAHPLSEAGWSMILTGTAEESLLGEAVRALAPSAHSVAGRTNIGVLAALIRESSLVISNDTSVSHIASALQTPSVVVFSGSEVDRWAPLDWTRHLPVLGTAGNWTDAHTPEVAAVLRQAERLLSQEAAHAFA